MRFMSEPHASAAPAQASTPANDPAHPLQHRKLPAHLRPYFANDAQGWRCIASANCTCVFGLNTSTSNLVYHLQRSKAHHISLELSKQKRFSPKPVPSSFFGQSLPPQKEVNLKADADEAILHLLLAHSLPFSLLDSPFFLSLLKILNSKYRAPSSRTFVKTILANAYTQAIAAYKCVFDDASVAVSVTTDEWTRHTFKFFNVSMYIVDAQFNRQVINAATFQLQERSTAHELHRALRKAVSELVQFDRIVGVTTDGARNEINMVALAERISMKCIIHTLQLCVRHAFDKVPGVKDTITKASALTTYFKRSIVAADELRHQQHGGSKLRLIQSVETRWDSVYLMFDRLHHERRNIKKALIDLKQEARDLSPEQWSHIEGMLAPLRHFYELTCTFSSADALLSDVPFLIDELQVTLDAQITNESEFVRQFRVTLSDEAEAELTMYLQPEHICMAAAFLDPRFKNLDILPVDGQLKHDVHLSVQELIERFPLPDATTEVQAPTATPSPVPGTLHQRMLSRFKSAPAAPALEITREIDNYLAIDALSLDCGRPLDWWRLHAAAFPMLSHLARLIMSIPPSSVESERTFSVGGLLYSDSRSRLSTANLQRSIFLKLNLPSLRSHREQRRQRRARRLRPTEQTLQPGSTADHDVPQPEEMSTAVPYAAFATTDDDWSDSSDGECSDST